MSFLLSVQPFCSLRFFEVIIPYATDENKKTSLVLLVDKRGFFDGQAVNYALEQADLKNVAKPMFLGRKRTGFSLCIADEFHLISLQLPNQGSS